MQKLKPPCINRWDMAMFQIGPLIIIRHQCLLNSPNYNKSVKYWFPDVLSLTSSYFALDELCTVHVSWKTVLASGFSWANIEITHCIHSDLGLQTEIWIWKDPTTSFTRVHSCLSFKPVDHIHGNPRIYGEI